MAKGKDTKITKSTQSAASHSVATTESSKDSEADDPALSRLQQRILDVFDTSLPAQGQDQALQDVKTHLFNRDFVAAFGRQDYREIYAIRWSASRALAYLDIFRRLNQYIADTPRTRDDTTRVAGPEPPDAESQVNGNLQALTIQNATTPTQRLNERSRARRQPGIRQILDIVQDRPPAYDADDSAPSYEEPPSYGSYVDPSGDPRRDIDGLHVVCLGGGAGAELVGLAGWLRTLLDDSSGDDAVESEGAAGPDLDTLRVTCVDLADWAQVVQMLNDRIHKPPPLSKYASAAAIAANTALLPEDSFYPTFQQRDLLDSNVDSLRNVFQAADVVTIMFTLNELYSTSVSKTQRLLFELTVSTRPGTLLLVVDSPGSYSTVTINGSEKKYPMQWLLDHTLLQASRNTGILRRGNHWEKLVSDESRWFRLPKGLKYRMELENMRYQIHLYRRQEV